MSRACCSRIVGLWWFLISSALVDSVLMLSFNHLDFLGVVSIILMPAGLFRKAERDLGQIVEVRGLNLLGTGDRRFHAGCPRLPLRPSWENHVFLRSPTSP